MKMDGCNEADRAFLRRQAHPQRHGRVPVSLHGLGHDRPPEIIAASDLLAPGIKAA
jgi:hypothetical protein